MASTFTFTNSVGSIGEESTQIHHIVIELSSQNGWSSISSVPSGSLTHLVDVSSSGVAGFRHNLDASYGAYSFSIGQDTFASGQCAVAEGTYTLAFGDSSHSEGNSTLARGSNAHAEGYITVANNGSESDASSHSEGSGIPLTISVLTVGTTDSDLCTYTSSGDFIYNIEAGGYIFDGTDFYAISDVTLSENEDYKTFHLTNITSADAGLSRLRSGSASMLVLASTAGLYAHAEGYGTNALGEDSHAEGELTIASGIDSHAEGANTVASGRISHAEGNATKSSGDYAHAEGDDTKASGQSSHAEGRSTTASGIYSHAEGYNTTASGFGSHAEGSGTTASGGHAEGQSTTASNGAHAEGQFTTASGGSSHAEGNSTIASGAFSHSGGSYTVAAKHSQTTIGLYNVIDDSTTSPYPVRPSSISADRLGKYGFIIGNGSSENNRSNAFAVQWDGTVEAAGNIKISGTPTATNDAATKGYVDTAISNVPTGGAQNIVDGNATGSIRQINAIDSSTYPLGQDAAAFGAASKASGAYSHAEGYNTTASGDSSHSEGRSTLALGPNPHAEGRFTVAVGSSDSETQVSSHSEGTGVYLTLSEFTVGNTDSDFCTYTDDGEYFNNIWNGGYLYDGSDFYWISGVTVPVDQNYETFYLQNVTTPDLGLSRLRAGTDITSLVLANTARSSSHTEGCGTNALGECSHAEGHATLALGLNSHAEGDNTVASGDTSHAEGLYTTASGYYSHAEGSSAVASGHYSHAEGGNALASGSTSHAEGSNTVASGSVSHAEGSGAVASGKISHAEGRHTTASGECAHAGGYYTAAAKFAQTTIGVYNIVDDSTTSPYPTLPDTVTAAQLGKYGFVIGNGSSSTSRSNAFAVQWDGTVETAKGNLSGVQIVRW